MMATPARGWEASARLARVVSIVCACVAEPLASWPQMSTATTANLMGVNMLNVGADGHGGWRSFTASVDTVVVHVANEGSDSNDGLSPAEEAAAHAQQELTECCAQVVAGRLVAREAEEVPECELEDAGGEEQNGERREGGER